MIDASPIPCFSGHGLACVRGGRTVFAGLDFKLTGGGALLLLGPNGSGKSSLLRLMAGLLPAYAGHLTWNGQPVADDPQAHAERVHYVGHHDAVKGVLTAQENLGVWARLHDPATAAVQARAALVRFGLGRLADVPGRMLSAGQKRRLNLARLLAAPAPVWLLDEPTTALDQRSIANLQTVLADHRADGGLVVLSTHAEIALPGATVLHMDQVGAGS